jgi:hypothetical protein
MLIIRCLEDCFCWRLVGVSLARRFETPVSLRRNVVYCLSKLASQGELGVGPSSMVYE